MTDIDPTADCDERGESPNKRVVLIVEDNEDYLAIFSTYLRHAGFTVLEAQSGQEGLEAARRCHPDIILMDGGLPIVDGWSATEQLKVDATTAHIPVLMIAAHVFAEHRDRSVASRADGHVTKTADPKEVLAEVRRLLISRATESRANGAAREMNP